jgi:hypothetical protein
VCWWCSTACRWTAPHSAEPSATTPSTPCVHAFEIELGGRDFYIAAAKHTSDEAMHDMFERLAAMEREHIDTLVQRYHLPPPPDADGDLHPGVLQAGGHDTPDDPIDCWRWRSRWSSGPSVLPSRIAHGRARCL